jgi:hypothetical protein
VAAFYGLRNRLGLTGIRDRLGLIKREPTPLEIAIAAVTMGRTEGQLADVRPLVARIVEMYRRGVAEFPGYGDSMWSEINKLAAPLHKLLIEGPLDEVAEALNRPDTTNLFQGFDNPVAAPYGFVAEDRNLLSIELGPQASARIYVALRRLAEAVGAVKIANPETLTGTFLTPDQYLALLDEKIGVELRFPNFYPGEEGIKTSRGVISFRPLQAIYQAWRLRELGARRALEIGAGLGRTAFYARCFGIEQYTILDIPLSRVAQAHFLGRALCDDQVGLDGDARRPVRIVGPRFADETDERFDVILNVDSLSEMDHAVAANYLAFARRATQTFLSINREWDGAPRVADLLHGASTTRYPYWMRDGYVEETARFPARDAGVNAGA